MLDSKLMQLIKTLNQKELKQLYDYVCSPIYNKNQLIIQLCGLIVHAYPNDEKSLEKIHVQKQLFPNKKNAASHLRKAMSQLGEKVLDFFVFLKIEEEKTYQKHLLHESLIRRGLGKFFEQSFRRVKQQLTITENTNTYYYNYLLESDLYHFTLKNGNRTVHTNLQEVVNKFDWYYISNKLRYCCAMFNTQSIIASDYHFFLLDDLLTALARIPIEDKPIIQFYYTILLMLKEDDGNIHFEQLKDLLQEEGEKVETKELYFIYTLATNYCIAKFKDGKAIYLRELFELYKQMLEKGLLFDGEYLPVHWFKNMVTAASRLGDFEWAKSFIEQYKKKLPALHRKSTVYFNYGIIAFYEEDYNTTLTHLNKVDFVDFYDHLNCEMLLLKTHYQLQNFQILTTKTDAFRMFIKRNKSISNNNALAYRNFINLFKRLIKCAQDGRKGNYFTNIQKKLEKAIPKLHKNIQDTEPLIDKKWLLQEIKTLQEHLHKNVLT